MGSRQWLDQNGRPLPVFTMKNGQSVAYTAAAGVITNAISSECSLIVVWCSTDAYVRLGNGVTTADATDIHLLANTWVYLPIVAAASKVAAVQITTGGTLHVTECF